MLADAMRATAADARRRLRRAAQVEPAAPESVDAWAARLYAAPSRVDLL
eukprot:gene3370-5988_t